MKKEITLNNGKTITVKESELSGLTFNDIDLSYAGLWDIYNKDTFINYIKMKLDEKKAIKIATPILIKELNINIKHVMKPRFSVFDAIGISATTIDENHISIDDVYLEFKYITGHTHDDYQQIVIDANKLNSLINIQQETMDKVFIIYVYKDNYIRVFDIENHRQYYQINKKPIIATKYKALGEENNTKIQTLYYYKNYYTQIFN